MLTLHVNIDAFGVLIEPRFDGPIAAVWKYFCLHGFGRATFHGSSRKQRTASGGHVKPGCSVTAAFLCYPWTELRPRTESVWDVIFHVGYAAAGHGLCEGTGGLRRAGRSWCARRCRCHGRRGGRT